LDSYAAPPVDGETLFLAMQAYPKKTSLGLDAWYPLELASLPRCVVDDFASFLTCCQSWLAWPTCFHANLMALLPKPQGGWRFVAKTSMVYRIWNLVRRPAVKAWEAKTAAPWDYAKPGSSAMSAALSRALADEIAQAHGQHACAVLWDFEKLFDSIYPALLVRRALALGYPLVDLVLGLRVHLSPRCLQVAGLCSLPVWVDRSILAGCSQSIPLTRAFLKQDLGQVVHASGASLSLFVDDVGVLSTSPSPWLAASSLVASCRAFVAMAKRLALSISSKSVLLSSSPALDQRLAKAKRTYGIPASLGPGGRDLGL